MIWPLDAALRWQAARAAVGRTPADVVFTENKWRLLRYRARTEGIAFSTPILIVPSLINRHYVLDLLPGKSFIEFLVGRGHDVYCMDWGTPGDEDRYLEFDDVCDRYLGRALRFTARSAGAKSAHVLGYCLGGTLAAIHGAAYPERFASLVALASPIAFHDTGLLSTWTRSKSFDVNELVEAMGNVPWQLMQSAFLMLRPTLPLSKAVHVLDKASDDEFLNGFSFPGACYARYVEELYRKDALVGGSFTLSGKPVKLENITCPTLAITFQHDNIVPPESAAVLLERVGAKDKQRIHLPGGHVGAVVSKKAAATLWPRIAEFWEERDGARRAKRARR